MGDRRQAMTKSREDAVHKSVMIGSLAQLTHAIAEGEDVDGLDREGRTPLFYAAGDGAVEIASALIQHGAACNPRDRNLETPLHFAAREFRIATATLLLQYGATVDAQDFYGNTPLSHAVFASRGRGEMIELLLSAGADRELKNTHGVSPLDLAHTIANYDVRQFFQCP